MNAKASTHHGAVHESMDDIARSLAPGAELDDVPLLQRLAKRNALSGVGCGAEFFDVGVPEGYRAAVAAFPAAKGSTPG